MISAGQLEVVSPFSNLLSDEHEIIPDCWANKTISAFPRSHSQPLCIFFHLKTTIGQTRESVFPSGSLSCWNTHQHILIGIYHISSPLRLDKSVYKSIKEKTIVVIMSYCLTIFWQHFSHLASVKIIPFFGSQFSVSSQSTRLFFSGLVVWVDVFIQKAPSAMAACISDDL